MSLPKNILIAIAFNIKVFKCMRITSGFQLNKFSIYFNTNDFKEMDADKVTKLVRVLNAKQHKNISILILK